MSKKQEVAVKFEPQGRTVFVLPGTRLLEASARAGIILDMPCGGQGTCGKCRVRITEGAGAPNDAERKRFSTEELDDGWRLGCQARIVERTTVEVPATSLLASFQKILAGTGDRIEGTIDPAVRKQYVTLDQPALGNDHADLHRLELRLGQFKADLELIRDIPRRLREGNWQGTAVMVDGKLIDFETGDSTGHAYVAAFDIGTTTMVGVLVDLNTGRELADVARMNPQTSFGDDVLSRILHAREHPEGLEQLHEAVVADVNSMIGELAEKAGIPPTSIYEVAVAGNTTMQQLLLGLDVGALGEVPFVPAAARGLWLRAREIKLAIHPRGRLYVFPVIGGFVGGDTVSGLLVTELTECEGATLFVDIGTNGEIVLCTCDRLLAASAAAGPAFEGARIRHGMRAMNGAIEKVMVDDGQLVINVIGNTAPTGLCGSALIDLVAELLRCGVISREGRLLPVDELPDGLSEDLQSRVVQREGDVEFVLADADESGIDEPVTLTQRDVRELQLANGAIKAGIQILLQQAGLQATDLERVLIAGGFGNFIRRNNAQRIGLLPHDVPHPRIRFVGNTSVAGARLAAASRTARAEAEAIARKAEHVDLSQDLTFQMAFAEAMIFPEGEGGDD